MGVARSGDRTATNKRRGDRRGKGIVTRVATIVVASLAIGAARSDDRRY